MEMGTETGKGRHAFLRLLFGRMLALAVAATAGACLYTSLEGEGAYRRWLTFMFEKPSGLGILGLFVISISGKTVLDVLQALKPTLPSADSVRTMDAFMEVPAGRDGWAETAAKWLAERGFRYVDTNSYAVMGIKGRWLFIPAALCRLGLVLLITAGAASHNFRQTDTAILAPGRGGSLFGMPVELTELKTGMPASHLQVGQERSFLIKGASASLRVKDVTATVSAGWPEHSRGLWMRITGIGFVQTFLTGKGEGETRPLMLDVFPPGRQSRVEIGGNVFKMALWPERIVKKGRLSGEFYNLAAPSYLVAAADANPVVLKEDGTRQKIADTYYSIGSRDHWVRIEAVRDPTLGVIHLGFFVLGSGLLLLPLNLYWYRKEFVLAQSGGGIIFGYQEQILKKWGVYRFYGWKDEIMDILHEYR